MQHITFRVIDRQNGTVLRKGLTYKKASNYASYLNRSENYFFNYVVRIDRR